MSAPGSGFDESGMNSFNFHYAFDAVGSDWLLEQLVGIARLNRATAPLGCGATKLIHGITQAASTYHPQGALCVAVPEPSSHVRGGNLSPTPLHSFSCRER